MDPELAAWLTSVGHSGAKIYWQPSNHSYPTIDTWTCPGNLSASAIYDAFTADLTVYDLVDKYYAVPVPVEKPDVDVLVATVRRMMQNYMGVATFLETDSARERFSDRVEAIDVYIGNEAEQSPRCVVGTSLVECLQQRWMRSQALIGTPVEKSALWDAYNLKVNAYYSPRADAVYIPWTIMQEPFYSVEVRNTM
jgi:predicted metalloendopeptidase